MTAAASRSVRPFERAAEEQRRGQPVAGDVIAQVDDVARLLAAEHGRRARAAPRGRSGRRRRSSTTRIPRSPIRRWKPRFVITRHGDQVDARGRARGSRGSGRRRPRSPCRVDREHAVAVAVERDAEVEAAVARRRRWSSERSVAPQPTLMFVAVGRRRATGDDLRAELLERLRRDARVGAVRAVDGDPEPARGRCRSARRCARGSSRSRPRRGRSRPARSPAGRRAAPRSPPRRVGQLPAVARRRA